MSEKLNTYLVAITIIEGRHYLWDNMTSAVLVRVGNKKKSTAVQKCSDSPFYNEYFVFELEATYDKFLEKAIVLTVIQPRTFCRRRKILGSVKLDVATVVNQKNSQFYHKWAVLASPKADVASGPTGYLKVDITVLARGQTPKLPLNIVNDEIEGNLLTPMAFVGERQRARFTFDIYRCEHLQSKSIHLHNIQGGQKPPSEMKPSTHVVVTFAGSVVSTTVRKATPDPIYNERLTITDLFPPLCQRVKVELCFTGIKKTVHALHHLNLKHISNDAVEGFLPTFGPAYLYLYSKQNLEGYLGTLLMSVKTDFLDDSVSTSAGQKVSVQHSLTPLSEEKHFQFEDTYLFASIFEVSSISKKYHDKPISFHMTFGHIVTYSEPGDGFGDVSAVNSTPGEKPLKSGRGFYYLDYGERKPCLRIRSKWPDFRKRMFHSNMLEKISNSLKSNLNEIEEMFRKYSPSTALMIEEKLRETIDSLYTKGKKYVEIISTRYEFDYGTVLDQDRVKMCLRVMNGILDKLLVLQTNKSKKLIFRHLDDIQKKIEALVEDAQPCWPDIFIFMTCSSKKVGCLRISARSVVFSQIEEEIGPHCGELRPLVFELERKSAVICKMEILMWLGLDKQQENCVANLPKGFRHEGRFLLAEEKYLFEAKAYIFEGEVQPGFDESGLVDPFVQVCYGKEMKETQVKKNVLVPLWDQTLTFHNVCVYGSKEHIQEHPPHFLVQMFDQDPMSVEIVGRAIIKPLVTFLPPEDQSSSLKLKFHLLRQQEEVLGEILSGFELVEIAQPTKLMEKDQVVAIPPYLKPRIESYRVEVLFWGVRQLRKVNLIRINRPKVTFYCGNKTLDSQVIENARKFANFTNYVATLDVNMALQEEYPEAFQFKLYDSRKFGVYVFAGISICDTTPFLFTPLTLEERLNMLSGVHYKSSSLVMRSVASSEIFVDNWERALMKRTEDVAKETSATKCWDLFTKCFKLFKRSAGLKKPTQSEYTLLPEEETDEDYSDFDWWTKFYASIDEIPSEQENLPPSSRNKLKVYSNELEHQPEFKGFSDILTSFEIFKGKRTGDEILDEQLTTAILKGSVKIYQWPPDDGQLDQYVTPNGSLVKDGVFSSFPDNHSVQYVLRLYCVRGLNLRPKDLNGRSDPYVRVQFGLKVVSDRDNYIPSDINPIFGRCFEFQGSFPETTTLTIQVYDYDATSKDDLIGETKIDLENRFFTKHRAKCGLAHTYFQSGYCQWRDQENPSDILSSTCKKWGLPTPEYTETSVSIGAKEFTPSDFKSSQDPCTDRENYALEALKRWQEMPVVGFKFVPEHVETRSLFTPDKPGIEQGKIQLWIDIFPRLDYPVPEKVNITPRKPISYELRVVVWNTEDVVLCEDDFFSGEKKSDIYVKGWLDHPQNTQYTDVHYRSLTGEGNFNWRFVFKFDYLATENKLVIRKKETIFSRSESETKVPCVLHLTVWDNDTFSADDFLGSLNLELSRMPRGARSSKKCNLSILEPNVKKVNLFKLRRTKGWWPFKATNKKTQQIELGGKIEAELQILTKEEAELNPVGMARQGPEPLPPPKLGDRIQHRHLDVESPFRLKCPDCKKSRDCQIVCFVLLVTLLLLIILVVLYLEGYVAQGPFCSKEKRGSLATAR